MTAIQQPVIEASSASYLHSAFGLEITDQNIEFLSGGLSGDRTYAVRCWDGRYVVKHWASEDWEYAERTATLQDQVRLDGAPVPAQRRSYRRRFAENGMTVQAYMPGRSVSTPTLDQARAFGAALGRLDRSLAKAPIDPFFLDQPSVFSRCKDIGQVAARYLPACDRRFPTGYREHLIAALRELEARLEPVANDPPILVHVDANQENAIFDDSGNVCLIDLTPEVRHRGYSLGAALYWWAYPWQSNRLNLEMLQVITRTYLESHALPPPVRRVIAAHMLNHSLMELAFPLACLVDEPPPGARPMEDVAGRLTRANLLFEARGQIDRALNAP